ncbi:hypothetical protein ACIOMM_34790 [Streptomyces sp. NPDC087908]|uniref:hypothetical protein n=1 Tax=Streptomyces sp. NPDC087908 TaxID=3365820 RepID=UPI0037F471F0
MDISASPYGYVAHGYMRAAVEGRSLDEFYGACSSPESRTRSATLLSGLGQDSDPVFVGSTLGEGSAVVNVEWVRSSETLRWSVDLVEEQGIWKVCGLTTGHVELDVT